MDTIRTIDMMLIDDLFDMGGGYVLNFTDRTFAQFFASELGVNIDDPRYAQGGNSKAKRLRYFLQNVDKPTAIRTLDALWQYREALRARTKEPEKLEDAGRKLRSLINRLEGRPDNTPPTPPASPAFDKAKIAQIKGNLLSITSLEPHARGYAFEKFLRDLFDAYGLAPQDPFRLRGEQIDGSFQFGNETYLVEAKWHGKPIGVGELHVFHGKIEQKAAWTRSLFVSNSGFTEEGLAAFGRGKRVICMDGYDLYEMLNREISLDEVLTRKVRGAAETGAPFLRVRDLFPN
ncbi:restriction endonuclease family protein [Paraburkholderia xenovorans LB400]|uniref:Restriction endonuclease type IV Mrr domain-containing protein n=1 Tax=Paraburkholderia xenovorans (strain LB400) TaxID=266265 RepID=Q13XM8_PARXL|nr:restriction endonuclease [Paraburkholderia xenovorans]ABE31161.1 Conserved hypothetical protein [Paraburkholderia xenovorans LB400]AIP32531.1 restriction endonuclease family protein [Paraburkholderia xenovorans LB400]